MTNINNINDINDVLIYKLWKNMKINEILKLSYVCKNYRNIWYNDKTWRYLIKRDFGVIYEDGDGIIAYKKLWIKDKLKHKYQIEEKNIWENSLEQYECIKKYISNLEYPEQDVFIEIEISNIECFKNMEEILEPYEWILVDKGSGLSTAEIISKEDIDYDSNQVILINISHPDDELFLFLTENNIPYTAPFGGDEYSGQYIIDHDNDLIYQSKVEYYLLHKNDPFVKTYTTPYIFQHIYYALSEVE
mgnify:CR=1 FL=1